MDDGGWLGHTELGGDVVGDPTGSAEIEMEVDLAETVPSLLVDGASTAGAQAPRIFRIGDLLRVGDGENGTGRRAAPTNQDDEPSWEQMRRWMRDDTNDPNLPPPHRRLGQSTILQPHRGNARTTRVLTSRDPITVDDDWIADAQAARRQLLEAALARESGPPRLPQNIIEMDQRVPENLIDALAQHASMANRSYTAPTNVDSLRRLQGFVPEVVGSSSSQASGESSRSQSPFVTPLPTMPGGRSAQKRRREAAGTSDGGGLSRYREALSLSQQLATLPAIAPERLPAYMRHSSAHISAIPTELNELDKCERITLSCCKTGPEALIATFSGDGKGGDNDAAAVRADHPVPRGAGIYYYEAEVISSGVSGYIAIGMCNKYTDLDRLTGWEPHSFAWHLDDGYFFKSQGHGLNMGWPKSGVGDVIGCGVDAGDSIFFTRNGQFIGKGCRLPVETDLVFPSIGLRTPGECLRLNFSGPFKYDIEQRAIDARQKVLAEVSHIPVCITLSTEPEAHSSSSSNTSRLLDMLQLLDTDDDEKPPGKKSRASPAPELAGLVRRPRVSPDRTKKKQKATKEEIKKEEAPASTSVKKRITEIDTPLGDVVLDYLRHSGFAKTTAALVPEMQHRMAQRRAGIKPAGDAADAKRDISTDDLGVQIKRLREACCSNDIGLVFRKLTSDFKSFWDSEQHACRFRGIAIEATNWAFRMHLIAYVSLLQAAWDGSIALPEWTAELFWGAPAASGESREVLDIAQQSQELYGDAKDSTAKAQLKDAFALLAYDSAAEVPPALRKVLTQNRLDVVVEELLHSIRIHASSPPESVLEQTYRQLKSTHQSLTTIFGINEAAYTGGGLL